MRKLIDSLLKDENGISEEAYNALVAYLEEKGEYGWAKYVRSADATDGRFYFSDGSQD